MARYAYMLLDEHETDVSRQALQLDHIGGFERIFIDRLNRGAVNNPPSRPQRERLLSVLRPDDLIFAGAADRLCDHLRDFLELWHQIEALGAHLVILEEGIDSRSQAGRQSIQVLESFARLEFSYHSQRKKAGIRAARQDGRRIGRPPAAVPADFRSICQSWARGEISGRDAAGQSGLGSTSFYKKAAELGFSSPRRKKQS